MPNISIKDNIKSLDQFKDLSWYYQKYGEYIYRGYVPYSTISNWNNNELVNYANFSEFTSKGKKWYRKSIKLPYAITNYITRNMYAETPTIKVPDEKEKERLLLYLNNADFFVREKKLQGTKINIGDYVLKPYIENNTIKIDYLIGTRFVATKIDNGEVKEGIFISIKDVYRDKKQWRYTRLEWHLELANEQGDIVGRQIKKELYKSRKTEGLGNKCRLDEFYEIFGEKVEDDTEEFYGLTIPTFVLGKNPDENNKDLDSGRGLGMFINTIDTIISVDEAFHAKSTDNVYGSMQKLTPEKALELQGYIDTSGNTRFVKHFDPNDPDIFIYGGDNIGDNKPEAYAPILRTEQHIASINTDIDMTSTNIGITAGTFRFDGKSIMTATQVINEKSDTAKTIREIERNTSEDWKNLFMLIKYYANQFLNDTLTYEKSDISIEWKDNIIADDISKRDRDWELVTAGGMPLYKFMAKWVAELNGDEELAKQWIAERSQEENMAYSSFEEQGQE